MWQFEHVCIPQCLCQTIFAILLWHLVVRRFHAQTVLAWAVRIVRHGPSQIFAEHPFQLCCNIACACFSGLIFLRKRWCPDWSNSNTFQQYKNPRKCRQRKAKMTQIVLRPPGLLRQPKSDTALETYIWCSACDALLSICTADHQSNLCAIHRDQEPSRKRVVWSIDWLHERRHDCSVCSQSLATSHPDSLNAAVSGCKTCTRAHRPDCRRES